MTRGGVEDIRLEAKTKDTKNIRGQGQEQPLRGQTPLRPRTGMVEAKDQGHKDTSASVLQKKRSSKIFFRRSQKKGLQKFFQAFSSTKPFLKFYFRRSTKFQQFKKKCCPRAENRAIFEDLRPRGQGQNQGLDLRGQGQGLQNVSLRPRTSSRTPPLLMTMMFFDVFLVVVYIKKRVFSLEFFFFFSF